MNKTQLNEFFQIVDDVIKYGCIEERMTPAEIKRICQPIRATEDGLARSTCSTEEMSAEEKERFFRKVNTPYGL